MGVPAEFEDGVWTCSICDSQLESGSPPAPESEVEWEPRQDRLVTIAEFDNPRTAHAAKGVLESEGIEAFLANEHTVGQFAGAAVGIGGVLLAVPEDDAARAFEIVPDLAGSESELESVEELEPQDAYDEMVEEPTNPAQVIAFLMFLVAITFLLVSWLDG